MAEEVDVEGRRHDGGRDALALLGAIVAADPDGIEVILNNCDGVALVTALCSMVINLLEYHGSSPAAWVAEEQARSRW